MPTPYAVSSWSYDQDQRLYNQVSQSAPARWLCQLGRSGSVLFQTGQRAKNMIALFGHTKIILDVKLQVFIAPWPRRPEG